MKHQTFLGDFFVDMERELPKKPKPFPVIKWVGAKQPLMYWVKNFLPDTFNDYYEPFLGGGSVFWYLVRNNMIKKNVYLTDLNPRLINLYTVIRDSPFSFIREMEKYSGKNNVEFYRSVQKKVYEDPIKDAGLFMYLNKTAYRGMYAEDKHGDMAIGFAYRPKVRFVDYDKIVNASAALRGVHLSVATFDEYPKLAKKGDFVYFDPPYYEAYTEYTSSGFPEYEHLNLKALCEQLDERGVLWMQSNNDEKWVMDTYNKYTIELEEIVYKVNHKKKVESLIFNYEKV